MSAGTQRRSGSTTRHSFDPLVTAKRKVDTIAAKLRTPADYDSDGGAHSVSGAASKLRFAIVAPAVTAAAVVVDEDGRRDASTIAMAGTTAATKVTIAARYARRRSCNSDDDSRGGAQFVGMPASQLACGSPIAPTRTGATVETNTAGVVPPPP